MSISVITSTNRQSNISIILNNFLRQSYAVKELIIILNYDNPDLNQWKNAIGNYSNISIYNIGKKKSLGYCLNYGVMKSKFNYIAKFDDDDYYGSLYLENSFKEMLKQKSDIIGKTSIYIFFKNEDVLGLRYSSKENCSVNRVCGSTLFFSKDIFNVLKFKDKNLGEDIEFCHDAKINGLKIYSTNRNDYIYFRNNISSHTWKISNQYLLRECINIVNSPDLNALIKKWQV